jgi:hypothetical protein
MDKTALVKDVDEQPQSSSSSSSRWYRRPEHNLNSTHRLQDIPATPLQKPQNGSVDLAGDVDDCDHVRDVQVGAGGELEQSPTPRSAWCRKPRPGRDDSSLVVGPDPELAEEQADEKTRRICGCSGPTFTIVLFFVVVVVAAAIAGGVAGAQASK